jgi:hypothetical protein
VLLAALLLVGIVPRVRAESILPGDPSGSNVFTLNFDENGNGSISINGGTFTPLQGDLAPSQGMDTLSWTTEGTEAVTISAGNFLGGSAELDFLQGGVKARDSTTTTIKRDDGTWSSFTLDTDKDHQEIPGTTRLDSYDPRNPGNWTYQSISTVPGQVLL